VIVTSITMKRYLDCDCRQDVKQLKLTPNPVATTFQPSDKPRPAFICPLTLKEMSGSLPFSYLVPCGCVFSAAGLKAVATPAEDKDKETNDGTLEKEPCPQCGKKFVNKSAAFGGDIRTINPEPEEVQKMLEFAPIKTGKKRKGAPVVNAVVDDTKEKPKKAKTEVASINASMGITRAVANELVAAEKARKASMSTAVQSLYQGKNGVDGKGTKETFLTRGTFTRVSLNSCSKYTTLTAIFLVCLKAYSTVVAFFFGFRRVGQPGVGLVCNTSADCFMSRFDCAGYQRMETG
jgi:hypothetical protein